jgi:type II secretory pathway pseudopilin PulG
MIGTKQQGYTIIEVMIFIAVSSLMFVLAVVSIGGRQQQVQFNQAVRDLDSKLQDIINDVSTGYFPKPSNLQCTVVSDTDQPTISVSATDIGIGTSEDCAFIGKVLQFSPEDNVGTTVNEARLYVYSLVGRRTTSGSAPASLAEAKPLTDVALLDQSDLQWGLRVVKVIETPGTDVGSVGVFSSFNSTFGNSEISNNQRLTISPISSTTLNQTSESLINRVNVITDNPVLTTEYVNIVNPPETILCLESADGRRDAAIILGGSGSSSTRVEFDNIPTGCNP